MSYRDRRESHGGSSRDRHGDDRRRSSASSSRRSRSPSPPPKPRSDKELPESFGRIPETTKDDDSNVLQRMTKKFVNAPLGSLTKCLDGGRKIKVWTRNFKEVRGICTGFVIAFDKHWNLVMSDVDEVYLKPRKSKTPYLESLQAAENFSELPKKVPKQKKDPKSQEDPKTQEDPISPENDPPPPKPIESGTESIASGTEGKKKKRRSKKKKRPSPQKRHVKKIFVRGDNIVMAAIMDKSEGEEEEEDEEEED